MRKSGFTLAELLITLFLLGVIFAVAGRLAIDFSTYYRTDSETTRKSMAAREVLKYLGRQSRQALTVTAGGSNLSLDLLDESSPRFPPLPLPDGATAPGGWVPNGPAVSVSYQLNGDGFEATRNGNTSVLMRGLTGFDATRAGTLVTLTLSWQRGRRVTSSQSKVYLDVAAP